MATKADRGTKRTCQNTDCATRFYDLNRDPIACPSCGQAFALVAASPVAAAAVAKAARPAPDPEFAPGMKPEDVPEGTEALADIETPDEPAVGEDDETFLEEEEEDGSNVSDIVGGDEGGGEDEN